MDEDRYENLLNEYMRDGWDYDNAIELAKQHLKVIDALDGCGLHLNDDAVLKIMKEWA